MITLSFVSIARSLETKGAAETVRDIEIEALATAWFESYDETQYDDDGALMSLSAEMARGAK